jgi:hypothetical protein
VKSLIVLGVGNSGTKILSNIIRKILEDEMSIEVKYRYEPLYWIGENGDTDLVLNFAGINEHNLFPLDSKEEKWNYFVEKYLNYEGIVKSIRVLSRLDSIYSESFEIYNCYKRVLFIFRLYA